MGIFHFTVFKYIIMYQSVSVCEVWLLIISNKSVSDQGDCRISSASIFYIDQN